MVQFTDRDEALARVYQEDAGGVLAVLIGQFRDFDLAEDALQDALSEALIQWRHDGPPENGAGWLLTVARRRAIDRIRRSATARDDANERELLMRLEDIDDESEADQPIPDERLQLIFTCCHPALGPDAQVALTLRSLCGLSTPEIARAYLVPEATMAQRIVCAKKKISATAIPYVVPAGRELANRLVPVLDCIYLIFNEGFSATEGDSPIRADLCLEAIRLGRILHGLMPHPEVGGLLALMLLHDSQRAARTNATGCYIPIAEHDRSLWNHAQIAEGTNLLLHCLGQRNPGPFQIQAAISAVHAQAKDVAATDWPQIAGLYNALSEMAPSAVVTLNHAVARANADTPEAGLALLEKAAGDLQAYQPFHAAHADLLKRAGRTADARNAYRRAIDLSTNTAERVFLEARLAELPNGASSRRSD